MACVTIQISDYLDNKRDRRGTCKECKMEVFWTVANLASHKRKNCIIPEEEKAQWSDPYVSVTLRNLDDYLENKNPITRFVLPKSYYYSQFTSILLTFQTWNLYFVRISSILD